MKTIIVTVLILVVIVVAATVFFAAVDIGSSGGASAGSGPAPIGPISELPSCENFTFDDSTTTADPNDVACGGGTFGCGPNEEAGILENGLLSECSPPDTSGSP